MAIVEDTVMQELRRRSCRSAQESRGGDRAAKGEDDVRTRPFPLISAPPIGSGNLKEIDGPKKQAIVRGGAHRTRIASGQRERARSRTGNDGVVRSEPRPESAGVLRIGRSQ